MSSYAHLPGRTEEFERYSLRQQMERVDDYFLGWETKLGRQLRSTSQLERDIAWGARDCLRKLASETRPGGRYHDYVLAHTIVLEHRTEAERRQYTRFYPTWFASFDGFERRKVAKTTTARNPEARMRETGLQGQVARTALKVGDRPPSQVDGSQHVFNRYLTATDQRAKVTASPIVCSIGGSFETSRSHLDKFTTPDQPLGGTSDLIDRAVACAYTTLGLTKLSWITSNNIVNARINPDAHPGLLTSQIYRTKAEAYNATTSLALQIFEALKTEELYPAAPYGVGGREKRQEREVGDEVNSRLIQMPEDAFNRLENAVAEPLLERFKWIKKDIRVGMTYAHGWYKLHFDKFDKCCHVKTFDWKAFDSTVPQVVIRKSFGLLRSCYPDGVHVDNLFAYLMQGFLRRYVVCPGGDVVLIDRGIPSGSGFTSLVGSVCNWILFRTTLLSFHSPKVVKSLRLSVQGDDSKLGYPFFVARIPSNRRLVAEARRLWGVVAGEDAPGTVSEGPATSAWLHMCQPFLSVRNHLGLPSWSVRDYCVTELGYRRGQPRARDAQYAWYGLMGFPAFGGPIHALWDDFMTWTQTQDDGDFKDPDWVPTMSSRLYGAMAVLHSEIGKENEVGQFVWGQKGRYRQAWTAAQSSRARHAKPPLDAEMVRGNSGATRHLVRSLARRLDGSPFPLRVPTVDHGLQPVPPAPPGEPPPLAIQRRNLPGLGRRSMCRKVAYVTGAVLAVSATVTLVPFDRVISYLRSSDNYPDVVVRGLLRAANL